MNDRSNSKEKTAIWMASVALFCLGATAQAGPCQDLEETEVFLRFLETAASASAPPDARAAAQLLRYAQRAEDQLLALAMHVSVDAQKTVARLTRVARDPASLARLPQRSATSNAIYKVRKAISKSCYKRRNLLDGAQARARAAEGDEKSGRGVRDDGEGTVLQSVALSAFVVIGLIGLCFLTAISGYLNVLFRGFFQSRTTCQIRAKVLAEQATVDGWIIVVGSGGFRFRPKDAAGQACLADAAGKTEVQLCFEDQHIDAQIRRVDTEHVGMYFVRPITLQLLAQMLLSSSIPPKRAPLGAMRANVKKDRPNA